MNKKLYITFGILLILTLIIGIVNYVKISSIPTVSIGGTSNFDSDIVISETLSVAKGSTFSGNVSTDGGLIVGGRKNYGEAASTALSATDICDYNIIQIDADGSGDDIGASISFPDDETLIADCLSASGDYKKFYIDGTSSTATTYLEIVGTGLIAEYASAAAITDITGSPLIQVEVWNTGTSLSWYFDIIDASVSYQLND
jgi:hypothetical protein